MDKTIWKQPIDFVSSRWKLLSVLNVIFFGVAFGVSLFAGLLFPSPYLPNQHVYILPSFLYGNLPLMILFIFCFNLVISAFSVITLPGFLFFPLSSALLVVRAVLWGLLLYPLTTWLVLAALPTLMLEGEAYVFAAGVGTLVGYSWLWKSRDLSRGKVFIEGMKKYMMAYVLVILLLLGAAIVESATITILQV